MEIRTSRAVRTIKAIRVLQAACVLAAVISFGSCSVLSYIFGSVFPATAMLAKAQADLSGIIPAGQGYSYHVRVAESGGYGYVVVIGNQSSGSVAFIYDLDLNLLKTTPVTGNGVAVDTAGNIAIGSQLLTPGTLAQSSVSLNGISINSINTNSGDAGGVDGFINSSSVVVNLSYNGGSSILGGTACTVTSTWNPSSITSTTLSTTIFNLQVSALLDDGVPADNLIAVLRTPGGNNNNSITCYFVAVSKVTLSGGPIETSPSRTNLESTSFGFANGCIMAYDLSSASFVRINPANGSTQSSFYSATDPSNTTFAYRVNGGSFYGFDQKSRILTKYGAWW
jgi:hypothetical protein